jgi:hypothetical protein
MHYNRKHCCSTQEMENKEMNEEKSGVAGLQGAQANRPRRGDSGKRPSFAVKCARAVGAKGRLPHRH